MSESDFDKADKLSGRRARMLFVVAIIFITQQGAFFSEAGDAARTVGTVKIGAWVVLSAVILAALVTGGMWLQPRKIRELANDEVTRAHRDKALRLGFINAMLTCLLLYVISMVTRVEAREAIHVITTVGLASALVSFAFMERQALRDA